MREKKRRGAGISFSEDLLRIADIAIGEESVKILHLDEFSLPKTVFSERKNLHKTAVEIKKILKKTHIAHKAYVSPADRDVTLKDKTLPPVRKREIFKLIESEIKDYAIFGHENVSLGFNVVSEEKDKIKILWAGLKESILMKILSFVKQMGISPVAVIPSSFAIAKFILRFYPNLSNAFVIINVDNAVTSITFVKDGKVILNYKHDVGLVDIQNENPTNINSWAGNILTTVTFVTRNKKLDLGEIFLVSQDGKPQRLLPFLTRRVSNPVIIPDLKMLVDFENEEDFLRIQKTGGSEFVVPLGLALLEASDSKDPLFCDISKHILVEKVSAKLKVMIISILLIIINGLALYLYPVLSSTLSRLKSNLAYTNTRIKIAEEEAKNTEKIKNELSALREELSKYDSIYKQLQNRIISSQLLDEIKKDLPDGVSVSSVLVDDNGKISISGYGKSYEDILQYEVNLASARFLRNASISEMAKNSSGIILFRMSAQSSEGVNDERK